MDLPLKNQNEEEAEFQASNQTFERLCKSRKTTCQYKRVYAFSMSRNLHVLICTSRYAVILESHAKQKHLFGMTCSIRESVGENRQQDSCCSRCGSTQSVLIFDV